MTGQYVSARSGLCSAFLFLLLGQLGGTPTSMKCRLILMTGHHMHMYLLNFDGHSVQYQQLLYAILHIQCILLRTTISYLTPE